MIKKYQLYAELEMHEVDENKNYIGCEYFGRDDLICKWEDVEAKLKEAFEAGCIAGETNYCSQYWDGERYKLREELFKEFMEGQDEVN